MTREEAERLIATMAADRPVVEAALYETVARFSGSEGKLRAEFVVRCYDRQTGYGFTIRSEGDWQRRRGLAWLHYHSVPCSDDRCRDRRRLRCSCGCGGEIYEAGGGY